MNPVERGEGDSLGLTRGLRSDRTGSTYTVAVLLSVSVAVVVGILFGGLRSGAGNIAQTSMLIGGLAGLATLAAAAVARRFETLVPARLNPWFGLALSALAGLVIGYLLQPAARPV